MFPLRRGTQLKSKQQSSSHSCISLASHAVRTTSPVSLPLSQGDTPTPTPEGLTAWARWLRNVYGGEEKVGESEGGGMGDRESGREGEVQWSRNRGEVTHGKERGKRHPARPRPSVLCPQFDEDPGPPIFSLRVLSAPFRSAEALLVALHHPASQQPSHHARPSFRDREPHHHLPHPHLPCSPRSGSCTRGCCERVLSVSKVSACCVSVLQSGTPEEAYPRFKPFSGTPVQSSGWKNVRQILVKQLNFFK